MDAPKGPFKILCFHPVTLFPEHMTSVTPKVYGPLKGTVKGTGNLANCRSVPRSFEKELVPVQFLKKGTSSWNERSFSQFLELFGYLSLQSCSL